MIKKRLLVELFILLLLIVFIGFNSKDSRSSSKAKSKSFQDYRQHIKNLVAKGKFHQAQMLSSSSLLRLQNVIKQSRSKISDASSYLFIGNIFEDLRGRIPPDLLHQPGLSKDYVNWTKYRLADIYFRQKEYNLALNYLKSILKAPAGYERNDRVLYLQSQIYGKKEDRVRELNSLYELIRRYPASWYANFAHMQLGVIYEKKGEYVISFKEYLKSGVLPFLAVLNFVAMSLLALLVFGFFFLLARVFFRKSIQDAKKTPFRKIDLFVVIMLLFTLPPMMTMFLMWLNYNYIGFFRGLNLEPTTFSLFLSDIIILAVVLGYLKKKYKIGNIDLGFFSRGFQFNVLLPIVLTAAGIIIAIIFFSILSLMSVRVPESPIQTIAQNTFSQGNPIKIILLFFIVSVAGPIAEELIFRVFLIKSFSKFTNTVFAVIFSSLFFAFFHQNLVLVPYFTALGLLFAITYIKTKSIIPSIVTHGLYNFTLFSLGFLFLNYH